MRILLDTHIALWAIADTSKLSNEVIKLLEKESNFPVKGFITAEQCTKT